MSDRDQYWYDRAKQYAYALYRLIGDGDGDPEDIYNMMVKDRFVDGYQEWIDG